jgi:uncharacterized protein YjiK
MKKIFYIMIGFLLLQGCMESAAIVQIPEASGICFSQNSETLFVVEDEGKVYEISRDGAILRQKRIGDYDLEGVACDDVHNRLLLAQEGEDAILVLSQKKLKLTKSIKIKKRFRGENILRRDKKHGLEGIAIVEDFILLSNQKNPSLLLKVTREDKAKVTILELFKHGHEDIAGLTYHDGYLFMVSDDENLLLKYDIKDKRVIATAKLPQASQEGVAFDNDGYIYIADDAGRVLKYKRERFGL